MKLKPTKLFFAVFILIFPMYAAAQNSKTAMSLINSGSAKFRTKDLSDTVRLEKTKEWIFVQMKVNGKVEKFIWDTGSAYSSIDQPDSAGFERITGSDLDFIDAVGAKQKSKLYKAGAVFIGGTEFNGITFMSLNTKTAASGTLKNYAGIIGLDIIDKVNWYFNWDKNEIVISSKPFERGAGQLVRYANYVDHNTLRLNAALPNGKKVNTALVVDFGAAGNTIYLNADQLEKFKSMKAELTEGTRGVGVSGGGYAQQTYRLLDDIDCTIGISGRNINVKSPISIGTNNRESVIGNHFFRQFNFVRNSMESVFIFYRRKTKFIDDEYRGISYGISFGKNENGELYINGFTKNPNLKNTNLRIGQLIKTLNGKNGSAFNDIIDIKNYLGKCIANGDCLKLAVATGAEYGLFPEKNELVVIN